MDPSGRGPELLELCLDGLNRLIHDYSRWLPLLEAIRTFVVTPGEEERVQMEIFRVVFPEAVREAVPS
jgi:hypothetical protein